MSELDELPEEGGDGLRSRTKKSPTAFRTISEVADELHIPQHVLRFWETKFPQVKPLKRGGGRRYYRPDDVLLLRRVSELLYTQGYTIKGVQRLLREGSRLEDVPMPPEPDVTPSPAEELGLPAPCDEMEVPAPEMPAQAEPTAEQMRLRGALQEALGALEAIRAALP